MLLIIQHKKSDLTFFSVSALLAVFMSIPTIWIKQAVDPWFLWIFFFFLKLLKLLCFVPESRNWEVKMTTKNSVEEQLLTLSWCRKSHLLSPCHKINTSFDTVLPHLQKSTEMLTQTYVISLVFSSRSLYCCSLKCNSSLSLCSCVLPSEGVVV